MRECTLSHITTRQIGLLTNVTITNPGYDGWKMGSELRVDLGSIVFVVEMARSKLHALRS